MNTTIEVEYWSIDDDGDLVPTGALSDVSEHVTRGDAASLLEVRMPRCETISGLRQAFVERLEVVLSEARKRDRRLVPLATPINGGRGRKCEGTSERAPLESIAEGEGGNGTSVVGSTDGDRIRHAIDGSNAACAAETAGARIHLEGDAVATQRNVLYALTPALALVNSSPYWQGERVANGARTHCYRRAAVDGDRRFRYVDSLEEWEHVRKQRYESIKEHTLATGVDPAVVADVMPDDIGWVPVALTNSDDDRNNGTNDDGKTPTLEWRVPDTALPSQLLQLVADLETVMTRLHRGVVHAGRYADGEHRGGDDITVGHVTNAEVALPRPDIVSELTETAIDIGLDATDVAAYLERMGFAVDDYHPIATRIDGRQYVTESDARELRLEYANRLEEDVRQLRRGLES